MNKLFIVIFLIITQNSVFTMNLPFDDEMENTVETIWPTGKNLPVQQEIKNRRGKHCFDKYLGKSPVYTDGKKYFVFFNNKKYTINPVAPCVLLLAGKERNQRFQEYLKRNA